MRSLFLTSLPLLTLLLGVGCAGNRASTTAPVNPAMSSAPTANAAASQAGTPITPAVIVTPDHSLAGKVALVNVAKGYVILTFPIGEIPAQNQPLFVYRNGLKVGKLKVTGPQRDFNTVADIEEGVCAVGDEVREN